MPFMGSEHNATSFVGSYYLLHRSFDEEKRSTGGRNAPDLPALHLMPCLCACSVTMMEWDVTQKRNHLIDAC